MAIIIPPGIIKEYHRKIQTEQSEPAAAPGEEAHIYNLYEELSMPLSDIIEIGRLGLEGRLENVQEKMDGQFLAFTVVDGQLRFFTKMDLQGQAAKNKKLEAIRTGGKGGGMTLDEIVSTYTGRRSNIAEGFAIAYEALEPVATPYQDSLFRNGEVVIASQIMVSKNPNTILYDSDSLRTVLAISLTEEPVNESSLETFKSEMKQASTDAFTMDEVPSAKLIEDLEEDDEQIKQLEKDLETVASDVGLSVSDSTVGDYIKARLEAFLSARYKFIPEDLVPDVADRFMTGKGKIALRIKKRVSPEEYQAFRDLDKAKARIVQEAIIPLENIIQRLGIMIIDKLDLVLTASNQDRLLKFVKDARIALEAGVDFGLESGDTKTLEGIRVALARIQANEDLFQRATEGIVFTHGGKTYKLTGLFTPINKLRGFFSRSMGREGFGKASLPGDEPDEKEIEEMLSEIIQHTVNTALREGGNAFRPRDSRGRPTGPPVTTDERISRSIANKITKEVEDNVLRPMGLDYLAAGSTATNKKEIGDVDLVVSEPDLPTLVAGLNGLPYLSSELVPGIPRVMELPGGQAATIMIELDGKYYQVDLFKSRSIEDTAWELSGGGEGEVKGEYHKLMLSLLAKIKGERESTSDRIVKYTVAFPGGWREKVNGVEVETGRIRDPDEYLPVLGIDVDKDKIKTFNQLIKYMSQSSSDQFREAFDRFEEYIGGRLMSKSERTRDAAKQAIDALDAAKSGVSESSYVRSLIRKILSEQDEEEGDISIASDTLISPEALDYESEAEEFKSATTWVGKTRAVQKILASSEFLGSDFEKSIGGKSSIGLMRFGLKSGSNDRHDFSLMMNRLYDALSPGHDDQVKELGPNEGPNPSGTYVAYQLTELGLIILFGIAGVTGGQRKAGYEYEINVRDSLEGSGIDATGGEDNSVSDVYVPTAAVDDDGRPETLGIEVKLPNAQAGEPTLAYDFDAGVFLATNPKPQNQDIANLINADSSRDKVGERLAKVRDAINTARLASGSPEIESMLRKISRDEYVNIAQPVLNDNPIDIGKGKLIKGALLAIYTVSAEILRKYYMLKRAGLVQVKGKGLFHLHPDYKISVGEGRATKLFDFADAMGSVYFRNFRGGNYGIRSQLTKSPLKTLPVSGIDLDSEQDRKDFIQAVKKSSFPNPKSLVKSIENTESTGDSDELPASLREIIRSML
jgi:hypothetical protein